MLRIEEREPHPSTKRPYFEQLAEGMRYTLDHAPIRQIILLAGVSTFFGRGMLELMPAFAAIIFDGDSTELAMLMAGAGIGAIGASLALSSRRFQSNLHTLVVAGALGVATSIVLFAMSRNLVMGSLVVAALGFFVSLASVGSQTEVQIHVDNRLRGRVMSLWTLTLIGGPAVGSVVAGALAGLIGSTCTALAFAAACIVLITLVGIRRPELPAKSALSPSAGEE